MLSIQRQDQVGFRKPAFKLNERASERAKERTNKGIEPLADARDDDDDNNYNNNENNNL